MARYTATTRLPPSKVIEKAERHFAYLSGGATTTSKTETSLCIDGPDGRITISICPSAEKGRPNELDIETSQFDSQVREFLRTL